MTDVDTLTIAEFLLARIAEDEVAARAAGEPDMLEERKPSGKPTGRLVPSGETLHDYTAGLAYYEGAPDAAVELIKRFGPARVLAECEAKRKIVELHQQCGSGTGYCDDGGHGYDPGEGCGTLAILAAVYADHPDYRKWKP